YGSRRSDNPRPTTANRCGAVTTAVVRHASCPGLTPQVGFTRLAALDDMQNSGKPEFCWHPSKKKRFIQGMDCRVRPGNDGGWVSEDDTGSTCPGEGDLVEGAGAEPFGGTGHRLAAERAIEADGWLVVRQRPDHQALQPALHQVAPRRGEQLAAEAETLEFR